MLFLIFGFLEFYDNENSEMPRLAPLISVPITLKRGKFDAATGSFQHTVCHNGEDLLDNQTLKEKILRDFGLQIPDFDDSTNGNIGPEHFFEQLTNIIAHKPRWRVRRQLTIGMLAFGKLAMWKDLDCKEHPEILKNHLVQSILTGGEGKDSDSALIDDYSIDDHQLANIHLVEDADASQHSAIIDVIDGKNLVISGPPGTGKSQTITNIIAAALNHGKKILFVSEKLAALEVVRRRLNRAGLGDFCLELHSHKTQKRQFLDDIQQRIAKSFARPPRYEEKIRHLQRKKDALTRYAQLMGSRLGNALDLTVQEIIWAVERRRQTLGDLTRRISPIHLDDAPRWTADAFEARRGKLGALARYHDQIRSFSSKHPWWGFLPKPLTPIERDAIAAELERALDYSAAASAAATEAQRLFDLAEQPTWKMAESIAAAIAKLKKNLPPHSILLPKLFDQKNDPAGHASGRLINNLATTLAAAQALLDSARESLHQIPATASEATGLQPKRTPPHLLEADLHETIQSAIELGTLAERFRNQISELRSGVKIARNESALQIQRIAKLECAHQLKSLTLKSIRSRISLLRERIEQLSKALHKIKQASDTAGLSLDITPDSLSQLIDPASTASIRKDYIVNEDSLALARDFQKHPLADQPLQDIAQEKKALDRELDACTLALDRFSRLSEIVRLDFDSTIESISRITTLVKVAISAPPELLEYRQASFSKASMMESVQKLKATLNHQKSQEAALSQNFHLEHLPPIDELRLAAGALRSRDGVLAYLDSNWRNARRLHERLSKSRRKISNHNRADELSDLARWLEERGAFLSNPEFTQSFGGLFKGLKTSPEKILRLYGWYQSSRELLAQQPGLLQQIDLTKIPEDIIAELAAKFKQCAADLRLLDALKARDSRIFGIDSMQHNSSETIKALRTASSRAGSILDFFSDKVDISLSPRQATHQLQVKFFIDSAGSEIKLALDGNALIGDALGHNLNSIYAAAEKPWPESLAELIGFADQIDKITEAAADFIQEDNPLGMAVDLAGSWSQLESKWRKIEPQLAIEQTQTWEDTARLAHVSAACLREYLEPLKKYAKPGISVSEIVSALSRVTEAFEALDRLSADAAVIHTFGDSIRREQTDIQAIKETHLWGSSVTQSGLPNGIKNRLLTESAKDHLEHASAIFAAIDSNCSKAKSAIEKLNVLGRFSWQEWLNSQELTDDFNPRTLAQKIGIAIENLNALLPWAQYLSLREQVSRVSELESFVKLLESHMLPAAALEAAFEFSVYQSIATRNYRSLPELASFDGLHHDALRSEFQRLDEEMISLTGEELAHQISKRTTLPKGTTGLRAGDYSGIPLLRREIEKQKNHIPIRQLIKRSGNALLELKPCFMMGPLSVAQYLEHGKLKFDLIIMDEASQLSPENAIGAITRGQQLVVVGDSKQLPPTDFFTRLEDNGDEDDPEDAPAVAAGMESILDVCQQVFRQRSLTRHYRSQHESLIAFSNHHFYKNLVVFPSPHGKSPDLGINYRYIKDAFYESKPLNHNKKEASNVAEAILDHAIFRPQESLGVVALNKKQSELIEEEISKRARGIKEYDQFIERWNQEGWPFFIKNLENVQGDERDVIFISTTFGKSKGANKPSQNFGPISTSTGWRRLNVLFTRARKRIELFTSMQPEDVFVDEKTTQGTRILRSYLEFAKSGNLAIINPSSREPDSDFEVAVANVIKSMNFEVQPQLGVAGYFIDIAVRNPDRPGEFLAAIECDGATYHSSKSARERDRIRQQILESLGWRGKIHRIWSTDWFYNPIREIERLQHFLQMRRQQSIQDAQDDQQKPERAAEPSSTQRDRGRVEPKPSITENQVVQVGDFVSFRFLDQPEKVHTKLIADSENNPRLNILNEHTPLAQALLGLSTAEVGAMSMDNTQTRQIEIINIQRGLSL